MGYRVGNECFKDIEQATDYKMSLVVPTITQDGRLIYPIKHNKTWTYNNQTINLTFGECDPIQDFKDGAKISGSFVLLFVLVFGIRTIYNLVTQD